MAGKCELIKIKPLSISIGIIKDISIQIEECPKKKNTKFYYNFLIRKRSHLILDSSVVYFSRSDVLVAGFTRDLDSVIILLLHPKEAFHVFLDTKSRYPTFEAKSHHRLFSRELLKRVSGRQDAQLYANRHRRSCTGY